MDLGYIKPKEITEELKDSYLDYAMSVIVGRALPDVRDGLKPVHRRILYAMWDMGLRSNAKLRKSATVVGETLGKYHPHGDMAVYDTLVRLAQDFSMRYPLIQGQGNFGSIDGDAAAAMRYCVSGDTLIVTENGLVPIKEVSQGEEDVKFKVLSREKTINNASKWFDSGQHPIIKITTKSGLSLRGSYNHPILIWNKDFAANQPNFRWKLLSQIKEGDVAVIDRTSDMLWPQEEVSLKRYWPNHFGRRTEKKILPEKLNKELAFILGALISEGTVKQDEIEFCNSDKEFIYQFEKKWKNVFPDCRLHKFLRKPNSFGRKSYFTLEIHSRYVVEFLRNTGLAPAKSAQKTMPALILQSPKPVAAAFLQACFEGDGSISYSGKMTELSYISTSPAFIEQLHIILLRLGLFPARRFDRWRNMHKLYLRGLKNYSVFENQIGFACSAKTEKLRKAINRISKDYSQNDFIPFFSDFVRTSLDKNGDFKVREFAIKHNFDRYSNMEQNCSQVMLAVRPSLKNNIQSIFESLISNNYLFDPIVEKETRKKETVYSLRVDSECHSFVGNGFINHNTECRLTPLAEEMLADIDKDTVNWVDNYDGTRQEPTVLPAKLPQLLLNGSLGIAVGMATSIPPHNLTELVDGLVHLIDHPKATSEDLLKFIKGPDFPTGGAIYDRSAVTQAYSTGKGPVINRGIAKVEETKKGNFYILITEIPYQVNKAVLLEKIAELVKEKKLEGIKDIRDESSREGLRVVIELKSEAYPQKILNRLYKLTDLQKTFHLNLLALVDGLQPQVLSLKDILAQYIIHRKEVVTRRTQFDLTRAKERAHILEGIKKALDHIDAIISTIKKSGTKEEAHKNLCARFKFSDAQASAILEMKLQTLAGLERQKIEDELKEKIKLIKELEAILKDARKVLDVIQKELLAIKEKYGDERKTKVFVSPVGELKEEDLVPQEECIITLTQGGYIKRMNPKNYKAQKRGGKGMIGITTREEDTVKYLACVSTHDNLLFFTNIGRVFQTKAYEISEGSRVARGQAVVNFLQLAPGERVTALVATKELLKNLKKNSQPAGGQALEDNFLVMATKNGIIKKTTIKDFANVRRSGLIAITLRKGDELRWAKTTSGQDEIILVTAGGQSIHFKEKDVRPMGRNAAGVRGILLKRNDELVSMKVIGARWKNQNAKMELLVVTENGFGKKTDLKQFKVQHRGGSGIKACQVTSKTGKVVIAEILGPEEQDLIAMSDKGQTIRTPLASVSSLGRATQGVKIMKLEPGDKVASITCI